MLPANRCSSVAYLMSNRPGRSLSKTTGSPFANLPLKKRSVASSQGCFESLSGARRYLPDFPSKLRISFVAKFEARKRLKFLQTRVCPLPANHSANKSRASRCSKVRISLYRILALFADLPPICPFKFNRISLFLVWPSKCSIYFQHGGYEWELDAWKARPGQWSHWGIP